MRLNIVAMWLAVTVLAMVNYRANCAMEEQIKLDAMIVDSLNTLTRLEGKHLASENSDKTISK